NPLRKVTPTSAPILEPVPALRRTPATDARMWAQAASSSGRSPPRLWSAARSSRASDRFARSPTFGSVPRLPRSGAASASRTSSRDSSPSPGRWRGSSGRSCWRRTASTAAIQGSRSPRSAPTSSTSRDAVGTARTKARPRASELVSPAERMGSMGAVRCGFVALVVVFALLSRETVEVSPAELTIGSAAYLLLVLLTPWIVRRQPRNRAQWVITISLLADGLYLCWATYATGGTLSPLRFLLLVHVVAVTLLASYRTGLKIALWRSEE